VELAIFPRIANILVARSSVGHDDGVSLNMPAKRSAGILIYRRGGDQLEVLLVHPGGPFWKNKDEGAWSIPKGEPEEGEDLLTAAMREMREEIGFESRAKLIDLGSVRQKGGKTVYAWAIELEPNTTIAPASNTFEMEWPPRSGKMQAFPEIDRAEFFVTAVAEKKINPSQRVFLERLRANVD
jgi:predicted NUDIX family NTP pyrophosphohydrolase